MAQRNEERQNTRTFEEIEGMPTIQQRTQWASEALGTFAALSGVNEKYPAGTQVAELVAALHQLCTERGISFGRCLAHAGLIYSEQRDAVARPELVNMQPTRNGGWQKERLPSREEQGLGQPTRQ